MVGPDALTGGVPAAIPGGLAETDPDTGAEVAQTAGLNLAPLFI
jgi:hypothetical protein